MKHLVCLFTLCLVAISQAVPDRFVRLDPATIRKAIERAATTLTTTEAPVKHTTILTPVEAATTLAQETSTKSKARSQGTTADRTRLVTDLFKDYNKRVNPDDVKLVFGANLLDFHVHETKQALESHIWLSYNWTDQRLAWNPEEYGGAELVVLDIDDVWKPDVTLYNSADTAKMMNCWKTNVLLSSSGRLLWIPPCKMTSKCSLNLNKEPYGENTCILRFGSWTFDGNSMDLQLGEKTAMDVSELDNTSGFEIVGNVAERVEKYYDCCDEPYITVIFNLTLKRIPGEELFKRL